MQPLIEQVIHRGNHYKPFLVLFGFLWKWKKPNASNWFPFSSTHSPARSFNVFLKCNFADSAQTFRRFSPAFCPKTWAFSVLLEPFALEFRENCTQKLQVLHLFRRNKTSATATAAAAATARQQHQRHASNSNIAGWRSSEVKAGFWFWPAPELAQQLFTRKCSAALTLNLQRGYGDMG